MRYVVLGLCVFATACADGAAPTAPTSSVSQTVGGLAVTKKRTEPKVLPFKGTLQATETGLNSPSHHLEGSGNATHLGRFEYTADLTIDTATGIGVGRVTYTAANGDELRATTTGNVVSLVFPILTVEETQTITGGTGRFSDASGTILVNRTVNLETGATTASFTSETFSLGH